MPTPQAMEVRLLRSQRRADENMMRQAWGGDVRKLRASDAPGPSFAGEARCGTIESPMRLVSMIAVLQQSGYMCN